MKVMVIESLADELIPERYAKTVMNSAKRLTHWKTIEVSQQDYDRYESLRIELDDLVEELKGDN
jgi:hypothetical protein